MNSSFANTFTRFMFLKRVLGAEENKDATQTYRNALLDILAEIPQAGSRTLVGCAASEALLLY